MSAIHHLVDLALSMNADLSFSGDSTCVNVSLGDSFICTPCTCTREENAQDCIEFLTELQHRARVTSDFRDTIKHPDDPTPDTFGDLLLPREKPATFGDLLRAKMPF